jgi:hypothetical protein
MCVKLLPVATPFLMHLNIFRNVDTNPKLKKEVNCVSKLQHVFETIALKHQYRAKPYKFTNEECQMLALPKHHQNNLLMGQA